jgi:hypothetical protein
MSIRDDRAVLGGSDQTYLRKYGQGTVKERLGDAIVAHEFRPATDVEICARQFRPFRDRGYPNRHGRVML